ncbi:MAG: hypothetical protein ACC726_10560 [Chloroflexota bacterium]
MSPADQLRRTKTQGHRRWSAEDVKRKLNGPIEVVIDDAVSYWLADASGRRLGPESTRTIHPMAQALRLERSGSDPEAMVLWAIFETGELYEVASGAILIDMAEASAGIPRRPRPVES